MASNPETLRSLRAAWRCDCDGHSHRLAGAPVGGMAEAARSMAAAIENITGHRPVSCPWRSAYDPLVQEVIKIVNLSDDGLAPVALGDDPPAVLIDGVAAYLRAYGAAKAERLERENRERQAQHGRKPR